MTASGPQDFLVIAGGTARPMWEDGQPRGRVPDPVALFDELECPPGVDEAEWVATSGGHNALMEGWPDWPGDYSCSHTPYQGWCNGCLFAFAFGAGKPIPSELCRHGEWERWFVEDDGSLTANPFYRPVDGLGNPWPIHPPSPYGEAFLARLHAQAARLEGEALEQLWQMYGEFCAAYDRLPPPTIPHPLDTLEA